MGNATIRFDVVVVGAGPAGSTAAYVSARAGLRTALIEKFRFPRDKLCGGGFTGRSYRYFREIFGEPVPTRLINSHQTIAFHSRGNLLGEMRDAPPLHMTMRRDLDTEVFRRAIDAGAKDFSGSAIVGLDPSSTEIKLQDGRNLTFDILIGADGVNSRVAKALFGRPFNPDKIGFGLEIEAPPGDNQVRIDFNAAHWGYGWSFPKPESTTIGVGGLLGKNADIKCAMKEYLRRLGQPVDFRFKGQFLPFGDFRPTPGIGNIILAGDAAGLVDPITGEGIAYALKSGQLAGKAVSEALEAGEPGKVARRYQKKLVPVHRALRQARWLRTLIFAPPFSHHFDRTFHGSQTLKRQYLRLLAGDIEYGTLTWSTTRRLPSILQRTVRTPKILH